MQGGAGKLAGVGSGPGRARLKLMHHPAHKTLSAHRFIGVVCTALQCKVRMSAQYLQGLGVVQVK